MYKNIGYSVNVGDKVATIIDLKILGKETYDAVWAMDNEIRITAYRLVKTIAGTWNPCEESIRRIFKTDAIVYKVDQHIKDGKIVYYD